MIREEYCNKELSSLLMKKGYKGDINGNIISGKTEIVDKRISLSCAMRWLREIKNIVINIEYMKTFPTFKYYIYNTNDEKKHTDFNHYNAYEDAAKNAIDYCLKYLL